MSASFRLSLSPHKGLILIATLTTYDLTINKTGMVGGENKYINKNTGGDSQ